MVKSIPTLSNDCLKHQVIIEYPGHRPVYNSIRRAMFSLQIIQIFLTYSYNSLFLSLFPPFSPLKYDDDTSSIHTGMSRTYFKRYYKKMIKPFPEKEIIQMKELEKAALKEKHNMEAAESKNHKKIELKPLTIKQKEIEYLNNKKKASFNESLKRLKYIFKLYISELKRFDSHNNNGAYIRLLAINILINIDNLYCAIEIFPENIIYNYFKFIFYMNEVYSNKRTVLKKLGLSAHYRCNTSELAWFILQNELYHKKDYKYYYDILEKRMNNRLDHDNYLEILKYRKYVEAEAEGGE